MSKLEREVHGGAGADQASSKLDLEPDWNMKELTVSAHDVDPGACLAIVMLSLSPTADTGGHFSGAIGEALLGAIFKSFVKCDLSMPHVIACANTHTCMLGRSYQHCTAASTGRRTTC